MHRTKRSREISWLAAGIIAALAIAVFAGKSPLVKADEGWTIDRFDSTLTLQSDGQVAVNETIAVDFGTLEKHGIYRDLPETYATADGEEKYTTIDVQTVDIDGQPAQYDVIRNGANVRIKIGDPDETISGKHTYVIHYLAIGVLSSFDGYDELNWNVTGEEWDVPILKSSAEVRLPRDGIIQISCYVGSYGHTTSCSESTSTASVANFSQTTPLETYEGLTIAVGYESRLVPLLTVAAPKNAADILFESRIPIFTFGLVLAGGLFLLTMLWRHTGRDKWWDRKSLFDPNQKEAIMPFGGRDTVVVEYESPDKLRPAELGVLMDEKADTLDVSATVVDLAVRGYIEITEIPKKGIFSSTDYQLTRKKEMTDNAGVPLLEYEKMLMRGLFENDTTVKVSDLKEKFYKDLADIKEELYKHMVAKKFFTRNPSTTRKLHGFAAVVMMGIGFFVTTNAISPLLPDTLRAMMFGTGPALCILGFVYLILAIKALPQRTATGHELYRKARGYREFITHVETYRQRFFERENIFMEVLPYAMIFGATKKLAEAMKKMGAVPPTPTWYHSANAFNLATFSNSLSSFSSSLSSTMASAPSSSGSGGGGFSGGGFGGGGGGSW